MCPFLSPAPENPLSVSPNLSYSRHFLEMEPYDVWPLVSSFFHFTHSPGASSVIEHVSVIFYFLFLNNIPFYRQDTFCLSRHQLTDRGHFWFGALKTHAAVNKSLCRPKFSFLLGTHPGGELPGGTTVSCLTFWEAAKLFSKVAESFHAPTSSGV